MCIYKEEEEGRGIGRKEEKALHFFTFILKYNIEMSKKLTSSPANVHLSLSISLSLSQTRAHTQIHSNTHPHAHTYIQNT